MAFARALRQLTPALASQLLVSTTQIPVRCGVHHQLPCALVSLAHLHAATQMHQSSLYSRATDRRRHLGHTHVEHSTHDTSSHILKTGHIFRHFASDSEEADKIKYPIRTPDHVYVYNGPLAVTVTRLKKLSLFSCACTIAASPIIIYMSSASSFGAKASIALTLCGFGFFTTGLMHWFTSPYVHWLTYNSRTGLAEVETLTLFAKHQRRTFSQDEVQYPNTMRPQATFQVHKQVYYIDADNFEDKELLSKLTPKDQSQEVKPQSQ